MRNTTSLFLTLISYLVMLGMILALLLAAMPMSLMAQTNPPAETNLEGMAATNSVAANTNQLQTNQAVRIDNSGTHELVPSLGLGTTVVSLAPFVFVLAFIAVFAYFQNRRNKLAHETLRLMIEKGVPITPELISNLNIREKANPQRRYLLPGLVLVGAGIGAMTLAEKPGLIVLLIGSAFLIVWLVERKNSDGRQRTLSVTKQGIQIVEGKQNSAEQPPKP